MGCGDSIIKYLLFIFNLIFSLCGLALLILGVLAHVHVKKLSNGLPNGVPVGPISIIVLGSIIFVIAFFGCCGAIRENHCMVVTFAVFLLSILVIQIALAIYAFVVTKGIDVTEIQKEYKHILDEYWQDEKDRAAVDTVQSFMQCCGADGPNDFLNIPHSTGTYPASCCAPKEDKTITTCNADEVYRGGCKDEFVNLLKSVGRVIGGVALGIAGVELIGVVSALCLANSIRNADRRAFRV